MDVRGHGNTRTTDEDDLSADRLARSVRSVWIRFSYRGKELNLHLQDKMCIWKGDKSKLRQYLTCFLSISFLGRRGSNERHVTLSHIALLGGAHKQWLQLCFETPATFYCLLFP